MLDRRSFFKALSGAATGAVVLRHIPEAKAHNLNDGALAGANLEKPHNALESLEETMTKIAIRAAQEIHHLAYVPPFVDIADVCAMPKDIVNYPILGSGGRVVGNRPVRLMNHVESTFAVPDFAFVASPPLTAPAGLLRTYMTPACIGIARYITDASRGRRMLSYRRLVAPVPGCGAVAGYAKTPKVSLRALLYYSPETLQNTITIDSLFGVF